MGDVFDTIAKQFGIKRESAIRTYSVSVMAGFQEEVDELKLDKKTLGEALHLLAAMIRREPSVLTCRIEEQLRQVALDNPEISQSVDIVIAALHDPN